LLGAAELLVLYSSIYAAALILYGSVELCEQAVGPLGPRAALLAFAMLISLISMGLYHFHQRVSFREAAVRLGAGFVLGSLGLAALFYAFPSVSVTHELSAVAAAYALLLLLSLRYLFMRRVDENVFRRRTLIYGAGERASALGDLRRKADRRGFKIIGSVPAPGDTQMFENNGVLIKEQSIEFLARELDADEIVIAMDDRRGNLPVRELLNAKLRGIDVIDLMEFLERETGKIRIDLVNPGWLIFSPGFRASAFRKFAKRVVDIFVSSILLLVSAPVMLIVFLLIKVEDGIRAPVLYHQKRVGFRGEEFDVLKFRSMVVNAEANGQAVWAQQNDSRVTRLGQVLRKYRLDELPQVLNVLRGQMSFVGPRPERPKFVAELSETIPYYSERHTVKPGITGWAQLRYSYGATEEDAIEKLQYDLYYVKNHNLLLDFIIMLQTVEVILWGKGAR
jgi:sugar transferase (PEP-CTERM system associated)